MTKAQIRKLERESRQLRVFAADELAKAAWCVADGDDEGFEKCMDKVRRLTQMSGQKLIEARAASDLNGDSMIDQGEG